MDIIVDTWRIRVLGVAAAGAIAWSAAVPADAGHPARALVEETTSNVIEALKSQHEALSSDPRRLYEFVGEYILPHFDFERMSRRALGGKRWREVGPEQRARFVSEFRFLLVRTYATALNGYRDQAITYLDPVPGKKEDEVVIPMQFETAGGEVPVSYAMHRGEGGWRIYDVSISGGDAHQELQVVVPRRDRAPRDRRPDRASRGEEQGGVGLTAEAPGEPAPGAGARGVDSRTGPGPGPRRRVRTG